MDKNLQEELIQRIELEAEAITQLSIEIAQSFKRYFQKTGGQNIGLQCYSHDWIFNAVQGLYDRNCDFMAQINRVGRQSNVLSRILKETLQGKIQRLEHDSTD